MNIFQRMVPWWIPTKEDQRGWYTEELRSTPKDITNLLREFQDLSSKYNRRLEDFEADLTQNYNLYERYLSIKVMEQKLTFLWNRIEYKTIRKKELKEYLKDL